MNSLINDVPHFVLLIADGSGCRKFRRDLMKWNQSLEHPVEIHRNVQYRDALPLIQQAGIYVHTLSEEKTYGMPISVAEGMAAGSYILDVDREGSAGYHGPVGDTYTGVEDLVAKIRATGDWDESRWLEIEREGSRRASLRHAGRVVMAPAVRQWHELAGLEMPEMKNSAA